MSEGKDAKIDVMEPPSVEKTFSTDYGGKSKVHRNSSRISIQTPSGMGVGTCGICCISAAPSTEDVWDVPARYENHFGNELVH